MNVYAVTLWNHTETEFAETPAKAKYKYYKSHEIDDSVDFYDYIKQVKCKLLHKFHISDLFTDNIEQFNYMKEERGIPFAYLGMRVEIEGKPGTITGYSMGLNLSVCFDGQYCSYNCHPWWKARYFDNQGNLIKEYD